MQKPEVVYEGNQGAILLANNGQVGMRVKNIDMRQNFLRYMVEDKDTEIKYIRSEENPADITAKNIPKADYVKHTKRITEGEIWELVENERQNVKNNKVLDGVMDRDSTEYSSHTLTDSVNKENRNDWIFVTISRNGK